MHHKPLYLFFFLMSSSLCYGQALDQFSNSSDESPIIIEADKSVVCDETSNKCVATGNAMAQKSTNKIYADVLTVYFNEGKEREITSMVADGHVRMETPTDTAYGDHAHYDVALDRILMTGGNLKIETPEQTLTARDSIEYWHGKNQGIARGNAIAQFPEKEELVQADTLIAYFKPSTEKTEEGKEKLAIDRVEAEGNVLASGPKGVVTGDRGVYFAQTHMVEIVHNVKITQDKNVINGEYVRHNLNTNVTEMYTQAPGTTSSGPVKRISGLINPKDAKKMKEKSPETAQKGKNGHLFPVSAKNKKISTS
ncbi:MAG: hypothetical protein K2W92_04460 [Alphaproteobacteria bacterium]|nr:hypothetical protein [Alphaproteobacteria bacterium]